MKWKKTPELPVAKSSWSWRTICLHSTNCCWLVIHSRVQVDLHLECDRRTSTDCRLDWLLGPSSQRVVGCSESMWASGSKSFEQLEVRASCHHTSAGHSIDQLTYKDSTQIRAADSEQNSKGQSKPSEVHGGEAQGNEVERTTERLIYFLYNSKVP